MHKKFVLPLVLTFAVLIGFSAYVYSVAFWVTTVSWFPTYPTPTLVNPNTNITMLCNVTTTVGAGGTGNYLYWIEYNTTPIGGWANMTLTDSNFKLNSSIPLTFVPTNTGNYNLSWLKANVTVSSGAYMLRCNGKDLKNVVLVTGNIKNITINSSAPPTDSTPPTYSTITINNTNPAILDQVNFSYQASDNIQLDKTIFSWNATGIGCNVWANDTAIAFMSGNWSNVTQQIPATCLLANVGGISFQFYFNDTSNNWNTTPILNISGFNTGVANSCTYSSGTWLINCADNCQITTNTNMNGNAIIFYGTGSAYLNANIQNLSQRTFVTNCPITIGTGKVFG